MLIVRIIKIKKEFFSQIMQHRNLPAGEIQTNQNEYAAE
jgi:hypothetical protein